MTIRPEDRPLDRSSYSPSRAIELRPSRVSLFGYAHMPDLIPRQRQIDGDNLPDPELRFEQSELGYQRLTEAGYVAIGFDHFALPADSLAIAATEGRVHRNFQGFTDDPNEFLLGFGASAISSLPGLLVQNEKMSGDTGPWSRQTRARLSAACRAAKK